MQQCMQTYFGSFLIYWNKKTRANFIQKNHTEFYHTEQKTEQG